MNLLIDLLPDELEKVFIEKGIPKFRAKQIFDWLNKGADHFRDMKNIPNDLLNRLSEDYHIGIPAIAGRLESELDATRKYVMRFYDGSNVECVAMKYKYGISACISSQVGCKMGCRFCASTYSDFVRDLSAGEMLGQVLAVQKDLGERVANVVVMGVGEPLDNYKEVIRFIKLINDPKGLNIGQRHITISTCGIVPKIDALAEENFQVTLAVSLHSSENTERSNIMPINRKYNIEEVILACKRYIEKTKRRITFEYALIKGVNDSKKDAEKLAKLLRGMMCHVNLIPVNQVKEAGYAKSEREAVNAFVRELENRRIEVTVRRELGGDISAACGQLRRDI